MGKIDLSKYCLNFSNEELFSFLIKPLKKYTQLSVFAYSDDEEKLNENSQETIKYITFDGEMKNTEFYMSFYGYKVYIYIGNVEFLFVDDNTDNLCDQDMLGDVIYRGMLNDKTHKEILEMFVDFIVLFIDAKTIKITGGYCGYIIRITKELEEKKETAFENIRIIVNMEQSCLSKKTIEQYTMNFIEELKNKMEHAIKQTFFEIFNKYGNEGIYAFALYNRDYCGFTPYPCANTIKHLEKQDTNNSLYSKYVPTYWKYYYQVDESFMLFSEIAKLIFNRGKDIIDTEIRSEISNSEINVKIIDAWLEVLVKLKSENFFKQIVGKDIFLAFFNVVNLKEMIISLNDNEYRNEYLPWLDNNMKKYDKDYCNNELMLKAWWNRNSE